MTSRLIGTHRTCSCPQGRYEAMRHYSPGSERSVINELEVAEALIAVANVRKMQGWSHYYRIRIGDCRLGVKLEEETVIVLRVLHRRDIYRKFPQ